MICDKVYLQLFSISFLRFQIYKNVKVKAHSQYHNESMQFKRSLSWTSPKVFQEFGKIRKVARRPSMMKYIFDKTASIPFLLELDNEDLLKPLR